MCTPATLVALNPHNKLSIFHKYGTTFHSPNSALDRRPLQDIPRPRRRLMSFAPVPTKFVNIVNSENGEEKAAKVLKQAQQQPEQRGRTCARSKNTY